MRYALISILFLISTVAFGQNSEEQNPDFEKFSGKAFTEALAELDEVFGFKFSYNPASLSDITVPNIDEKVKTIEQFLSVCLDNAPLAFENISGTFVIYPEEETPSKPSYRTNLTFSGVIKDRSTGEALPYATVALAGTDIYTISNTEGMFTLLNIPTDTLQLQIRYLGYDPYSITLMDKDPNKLLVCKLSAAQRDLPSVEITARVEDLIEIDPIPSKISFNPSQISQIPSLGENDLFSALRRLPGISGAEDASSGLKIRGGNSDENLVLFDGITVYHVDHFFGFLSAFNSNMVKNVQVMKGGFGPQYGGRASGVVNITGIDGNKVKPSLLLEANLLSANVLAELPVVQDKASLTIGYRRAYTDIIQTNAYQNLFNNIFNSSIPNSDGSTDVFDGENEPEYKYQDFNAKFNFNPTEKDAISLSYYEGEDDVKITFDGSFEGLRRQSEDDTKWGNRGGSIKWSHKWNKKLFSYFNYGASTYTSDLTAEESFFFEDDNTLISQLFFEQKVAVKDNSIRFDNVWEMGASSKVNLGYNYTKNEITLQAQNQSAILQDSLQEGTTHAGYLDFNQHWNRWTVNLGVRATQYDVLNNFYVDPRFSFSYAATEHLILKGAYGIYRQMIRRLNERNLYLSVPETWVLSSDNTVPVLTSNHYILGATLKSRGWNLDVEGYYKSEEGTVEYLYPQFGNPTGNLDQFSIGGSKDIFGTDIMLKKEYRRHDILLGYTFLQAKSKFDDIDDGVAFNSTGVSEHELNMVYHYQVKRWDFSAGFVFASGAPYTPVLGTFIITLPSGEQQQFISLGDANSANFDPYHRLDIEASYTMPIKKGSFQVGVSLYNVYNHENVQFIDYYEIPIEDSEFYSLGQNEVLTLGFTPSMFLKLRL